MRVEQANAPEQIRLITSAASTFVTFGTVGWTPYIDPTTALYSGTVSLFLAPGQLVDYTQNWTAAALTNKLVKITGGTGAGQVRCITTNTAQILTLEMPWTVIPDSTSTYSIHPVYTLPQYQISDVPILFSDVGTATGVARMVSGDNGQPSNNSYSVNLNDYDRHKLKITRVVKDIDSTYGSSDYSTKLQKQFNEKRFMPDTEHFVRVWTGTLPKNNTFRYNSNGALTSPIINTYVKLILEPYDTWNIYISDTTALSIEGYEAYNQDKNNFAEPFNITKGEMLLYGKKVGNYRLRIQQPLTELNNQPYSYGTSVNFDISIWDVLGFNNTAKKGSKINVGITGNSAGPHKWISSDPNIAIISDHPQDRTNDKKKQVDFIGKGTVFFWVIDQAGIPWCSKEITVS
jgi:hypothetical protein